MKSFSSFLILNTVFYGATVAAFQPPFLAWPPVLPTRYQNPTMMPFYFCRPHATTVRLYGSFAENSNNAKLSEADKDRLLLSEPALNAFIVAEMRHFVSETMAEYDKGYASNKRKWRMSNEEKVAAGLIHENDDGTATISDEYTEALGIFTEDGSQAVELICNTTSLAFTDGFVQQQGLMSALGSAICFFRDYFRQPRLIAACERIGLSDYAVAHHITDMYHHRCFRGAYTKTLTPSGMGEIAARIAVNLPLLDDGKTKEMDEHEDDECILWSPTTPGLCLKWKSEDEEWRKKRFERIQMEGTKDPRRGGSGTSR